MKEPVITLLTDFGLADHYVAVMKGVILNICPKARLVDISHEIEPFCIAEGAYTLAQAWKYFPIGTIHLAIVDPGVGGARRPVVAETGGHRFVAPDNGLLSMALDPEAGAQVREITARRYFRDPVNDTFHGRDIFAPVAAHLAKGLVPSRLGKIILNPVIGHFAKPTQLSDGHWRGLILKIDRFGNVITNFDQKTFHAIARRPFSLKSGRRTLTGYHPTYAAAPPGKLFALFGSTGYVEISVRESSAEAVLGLRPGGAIELIFGQ
jgi:S-adenosylmethionine hydrolase